jgi:hypothetical protein
VRARLSWALLSVSSFKARFLEDFVAIVVFAVFGVSVNVPLMGL